MMLIEIDDKSGFCYGVVRAIRKAENELNSHEKLYSLGEIVHNSIEVKRLEKLGLQSINHDGLHEIKNEKLLIRAHGEPPSTYDTAKQNEISIIDCTCPVVLKLQEQIKNNYKKIRKMNGQIVIFGKKNHAEVNGLIGQTGGNAIVVETAKDLELIDFSRPVSLFAQTTKSMEDFNTINEIIKQKIAEAGKDDSIVFESHNTVCGQVSSRKPHLEKFSKNHDIVVFVSGKQSSNGKILYSACKNVNEKTYMVEDENDLNSAWFVDAESVGVCGATSTPKWLMEQVAGKILKLTSGNNLNL
ncbi:MAG: 4-hydroxy-3-methylbut-2-enyl diphosphate reductase [Prevotellaceae bacterium]|jgi:4-hydroxy-3-methylbut-2-enyl diphosphate reductase|nr:4-hydroxy-3-methylbut-2-enyl diphosphate reductase [Prevotellaceae bacterium]